MGCGGAVLPAPFFVLANDAEDVVLAQQRIFFVTDFDFGAAVFGDEHAVAHFDFKGNALAFFVAFAGAERDDFGFLRFLFCGIGDDDPAFDVFFLIDRLHEDAIAERLDFYFGNSTGWLVG